MYRKIFVFFSFLLVLFLFFSCAKKPIFLPRLDGDFVCQVCGAIEGEPFAATVYADGRVVYASPDALVGVVASADGETLTLGGRELPADALGGLFLPARLLCDAYEVTGSGTEGKGGACFVDGANAHGSRRVYVDGAGEPCRVSGSFDGISADFELTWK